jgi:hypothetical protein
MRAARGSRRGAQLRLGWRCAPDEHAAWVKQRIERMQGCMSCAPRFRLSVHGCLLACGDCARKDIHMQRTTRRHRGMERCDREGMEWWDDRGVRPAQAE